MQGASFFLSQKPFLSSQRAHILIILYNICTTLHMFFNSFPEAFAFYYKTILDATTFIAYFFVAAGFCILNFPKVLNKMGILKIVLTFVVSYATCILFESLMFSLANLTRNQYAMQIIFSLSLPVIVTAFCLIFERGNRIIHAFIKTIILVSSVAVVEVLSKNTGFFMGSLSNSLAVIVIIARSLPYALFTLICLLLKQVDINRYRNLSSEMVTIVTALSSLLLVAAIYEQASTTQEISTNVLLSLLDVVLLFILNFSYYATYKNIEHRHRITNLEVQKTLEDAERMSIAIDQTNREELEKLRHDIKNQFSYLDVMLQQGQDKEAREYIAEYINNSNPVLNSFSCSNKVINSIINLELTKAKIKKIKIDVKVVVPPALPFQDIDLVSLLTNMIDNAIENYYSDSKEPIAVRIMKQNDFIRFIVSNPVNLEKVNLRSLTKTSKVGRGHGYGTKIIKNIAVAYNGYVDFNIEDGHFVYDAVMNLNTQRKEND